jgi:CBS domain-containing protein
MPSVRDVLSAKGSKVMTIAPGATVMEAVDKMNGAKIGALVVVDGSSIVGMFTERDVLQRVVGASRDPRELLVGEVMTTNVICCGPDEDIEDVATVMKERRVRHIPVTEGEDLTGMISIGDVSAQFASHQQAQISFLSEYIYGRV